MSSNILATCAASGGGGGDEFERFECVVLQTLLMQFDAANVCVKLIKK